MSVALTEDAVRARRKTVTRRLGWKFLKPGDRLTLVRKAMGRRRADGTVEPLVRIAEVEVVSVRRERLTAVTADDVDREGFPGWTPVDFRVFFAQAMHVPSNAEVTRIEWKYLDDAPSAEFDDRMLDALAAAISLNDPAPANLADRALAHIQQDGIQ